MIKKVKDFKKQYFKLKIALVLLPVLFTFLLIVFFILMLGGGGGSGQNTAVMIQKKNVSYEALIDAASIYAKNECVLAGSFSRVCCR